MLKVLVSSGVYPARLGLWALAFDRNAISALLFPRTKYIARKNTPRTSQGDTATLMAYAPATARKTKFVAMVSMSAKVSCFSQNV